MNNKLLSRRRFLAQCAMFSSTGIASSLASLGSLSLPAAVLAAGTRPSQYRAMVCIYLTGGNDLNMMVPLDDYDNYSAARGNLAIKKDDFLPISSGSGANSREFGLHPSFGSAYELYQSNKLAFVANTGAINTPTTASDFINNSVPLPPKLFAHNTQKEFVRAGLPFDGRRITGWAGRVADMFLASDGNNHPLNLSFTGDNLWQRGESTTAYGLSGASIPKLQGYDSTTSGPGGNERGAALRAINGLDTNHLLTKEYGRLVQSSLDLSSSLRSGISQTQIELKTEFPNTKFAQNLRHIANMINAREGMEMPQQVFYVNSGGWDHHRDMLANHSSNLRVLGDALLAFNNALEEMGLQNQVITFTNHDFGRTLTSNGSGSDHAWGGHQLVMGGTGTLQGGQVYGNHPELSPSDPQFLDFGDRGVLVPSTSTDQLSATIAKWFGDFSDSELVDLFPSLANFNDKTLGFIT